jgi:hypothetical protein
MINPQSNEATTHYSYRNSNQVPGEGVGFAQAM